MTVRVRYAPSPTGHLHIGGVRTALFNYLFAKHHHGQFILRFEDTDLERNVPGAEEEMLDGFRWLGISWDEGPDIGGDYGPYRCTERLSIYEGYLEALKAKGFAYPCFCTPEELATERDLAQAQGQTPKYSGKCRHLSEAERSRRLSGGETHSWRFAIPDDGAVEFEDLIRGRVRFESDDAGDFVIVKSNGIPTYNFQVVIDDALMKITHVIRGEEHLSNAPRQVLIYHALGLSVPMFAHLPQVLNTDRKKLSKRDPSVLPVHAYRSKGYLPASIVNFLALLGWSPGGEDEMFSMVELIERFDLDRVSRSGAVFDVDKLNWMAGQYMRRADLPTIADMVQAQLDDRAWVLPDHADGIWLERMVHLFQEKMICAEDFLSLAEGFFRVEIDWSSEAVQAMREAGARSVIEMYGELAERDSVWTPDSSKDRFKTIQKELGIKGKALYMPVRAAITGEIHGSDLQQSIACLPRQWALQRLQQALTKIDSDEE